LIGLRLAALSFQHRADFNTKLPELRGGTQYVMESILINLDAEDQWFRYHHLFKDLLNRQLRRHHPPNDIKMLHSRASEWFESQGLITESIKHALAAEDHVRAAEIVERDRHDEFDADRWYVVERWLAMLPAKVKRQRPSLLMTDGWVAYCRLQLERIPVLIQQCEAAVGDRTLETEQAGELEFFRGSIAYWTGEAENSRRHLEEALSRLGSKERYVESETELALGLARCMTGDKELAVTALEDRIRGTAKQKGVYLAKLIGALVLIHLLSGDLAYALAAVKRFRIVAAMNRLQNHRAWSDYFEGYAHLQTNEFDMASHHFSRALERRYILETRAVLDALKDVLGLAEAGGWIRPFVESGAPLADLLKQLRKQDVTVDYINRILAAFPEPESKPP
jgi:LuxR family maltose regulon positive regulatory protein